MKFGIYYSYWEQEWSADCLRHVEKVAKLGFDVIEIAAHHLNSFSPAHIDEIARAARDNNITVTSGLGPSQERNLSSPDAAVRKAGRAFFEETLVNIAKLDVHIIGGALHSYWPVDYTKPVDKEGDRARGVEGISSLADFAANLGIDLCIEVLNRFENHVINTAEEGVAFVRDVGKSNVKVMLDTFHMNIEEDSFSAAIRTAGPLLGHFHTGESDRRVPGKGRLPWHEIGAALREIDYQGAVVMEPFVKTGGGIGNDIRVWRDLSDGADEARMDQDAREALAFSRYVLAGGKP
ncbi:sugar phosphate isomerase/epimerase family protein [Martelella sp. FLE1502]